MLQVQRGYDLSVLFHVKVVRKPVSAQGYLDITVTVIPPPATQGTAFVQRVDLYQVSKPSSPIASLAGRGADPNYFFQNVKYPYPFTGGAAESLR